MMGHVKKMVIFMAIVTAALFASCGGSSSATPTTPATVPVSIESLVGATNIAVDASFQLEFDQAVDCSTVTSSTFYIVLASSGCDSSAALSASIDCDSSQATLDPTNDLTGGTSYSVCMTTGILYDDGTTFSGVTATFTTAGTNGVATVSSTSCSSTLECDSDQYCFYGACEDYSDIGVDTSVDCTDGEGNLDSTICVTQLGAPAGYDTDDWECLPTINTSASCSNYCVVIPIFFGYDGYPATESACDATDNATWVPDYSACLTDESFECSGDIGSGFSVIGSLHVTPPSYTEWVGMSQQVGDWPLTLTDSSTCNQETVRVWVSGKDDCERNDGYDCIGVNTSETGNYGLMEISSLSTTTSETTEVPDMYVYLTTSEIIGSLRAIGASSGDTVYFNYFWEFVDGSAQRSGSTAYDVRVIFTSNLCN